MSKNSVANTKDFKEINVWDICGFLTGKDNIFIDTRYEKPGAMGSFTAVANEKILMRMPVDPNRKKGSVRFAVHEGDVMVFTVKSQPKHPNIMFDHLRGDHILPCHWIDTDRERNFLAQRFVMTIYRSHDEGVSTSNNGQGSIGIDCTHEREDFDVPSSKNGDLLNPFAPFAVKGQFIKDLLNNASMDIYESFYDLLKDKDVAFVISQSKDSVSPDTAEDVTDVFHKIGGRDPFDLSGIHYTSLDTDSDRTNDIIIGRLLSMMVEDPDMNRPDRKGFASYDTKELEALYGKREGSICPIRYMEDCDEDILNSVSRLDLSSFRYYHMYQIARTLQDHIGMNFIEDDEGLDGAVEEYLADLPMLDDMDKRTDKKNVPISVHPAFARLGIFGRNDTPPEFSLYLRQCSPPEYMSEMCLMNLRDWMMFSKNYTNQDLDEEEASDLLREIEEF